MFSVTEHAVPRPIRLRINGNVFPRASRNRGEGQNTWIVIRVSWMRRVHERMWRPEVHSDGASLVENDDTTTTRQTNTDARRRGRRVARKLRLVATALPTFLRESTRTIAKHLFRVAARLQFFPRSQHTHQHICTAHARARHLTK